MASDVALRPATDADWRALFGPAHPVPDVWSGIVAASKYVVYGLGGIYCAVDGRWWVTFFRFPGAGRVVLAHKAAKHLLESAREAGITVHALADPDIEGSEKWVQRLGFAKTDETIGGLPVWALK